jgi:hypothetical protein
MTVAMQAALVATMRVFFTAWRVSESRNSSPYHFREKPENTDRLRASLKENTSKMAMGANRNTKISAV